MAPLDSGKRSRKCGRQPALSAADVQTANVLDKLPKSQQPKAKRSPQEIWMAGTKRVHLQLSTPSSRPGRQIQKGRRVFDQISRCTPGLPRLPRRTQGNTCVRPTSSKVRSQQSAIAWCAQRDVSRIRPRSRRPSSSPRLPRKVASSQRTQSVAEYHPRCKVHQRNRGRQIARSSPCGMTSRHQVSVIAHQKM